MNRNDYIRDMNKIKATREVKEGFKDAVRKAEKDEYVSEKRGISKNLVAVILALLAVNAGLIDMVLSSGKNEKVAEGGKTANENVVKENNLAIGKNLSLKVEVENEGEDETLNIEIKNDEKVDVTFNSEFKLFRLIEDKYIFQDYERETNKETITIKAGKSVKFSVKTRDINIEHCPMNLMENKDYKIIFESKEGILLTGAFSSGRKYADEVTLACGETINDSVVNLINEDGANSDSDGIGITVLAYNSVHESNFANNENNIYRKLKYLEYPHLYKYNERYDAYEQIGFDKELDKKIEEIPYIVAVQSSTSGSFVIPFAKLYDTDLEDGEYALIAKFSLGSEFSSVIAPDYEYATVAKFNMKNKVASADE